MLLGCPVCGRGVDWSHWPAFAWLKSGVPLYYFEVGWMRFEYLCFDCLGWARRNGAEWDGKIRWRWTGAQQQEITPTAVLHETESHSA